MKKLILALVLFSSLCADEHNKEMQVVEASRFADVYNVSMLSTLGFIRPVVIAGKLFFVIGGGLATLSDLCNVKLDNAAKSFSLLCIGLGLSYLDHKSMSAENECLNALSSDIKGVGHGCNILAKIASIGLIYCYIADKYL